MREFHSILPLYLIDLCPSKLLSCNDMRQGKGLMTTYWLQGASPALQRKDSDSQTKVNFGNQSY